MSLINSGENCHPDPELASGEGSTIGKHQYRFLVPRNDKYADPGSGSGMTIKKELIATKKPSRLLGKAF